MLSRVAYEKEAWTTAQVLELFKLAKNPEITISLPPVFQKGYAFVPESVVQRVRETLRYS